MLLHNFLNHFILINFLWNWKDVHSILVCKHLLRLYGLYTVFIRISWWALGWMSIFLCFLDSSWLTRRRWRSSLRSLPYLFVINSLVFLLLTCASALVSSWRFTTITSTLWLLLRFNENIKHFFLKNVLSVLYLIFSCFPNNSWKHHLTPQSLFIFLYE